MIGEEIARLAYQKVVLTDGFQHALRRQLAEGKATTVTHILLANSSIKAENYPAAQRHLEIAHQISPNATVVMNNLAMVLTHVDPPDLERARELIDRVVQLDPRNHDYQDSRGKILAKAGELNAAVAAYEKCLSMQPNRIDSRQELAKIYEQLGLPEMAEAQRQIIAKLSKPAEAP
jgi:cytochrome c-type biogenesis protein CcmH/NrfG